MHRHPSRRSDRRFFSAVILAILHAKQTGHDSTLAPWALRARAPRGGVRARRRGARSLTRVRLDSAEYAFYYYVVSPYLRRAVTPTRPSVKRNGAQGVGA